MLGITAGMDQKECYVSPCRKLRISAVAVPRRSPISCCGAEAYSHGLAVQQTIEFPQSLRYMWSTSLLCRSCSFPGGLQFSDTLTTCPLLSTTGAQNWTVPKNCRGSEVAVLQWSSISPSWRRGRFHGPGCSSDHWHSPVAEHGDRCPCCACHAGSQVLLWRRHSCSHICSSCCLCRGAELVSHGPSCSADHRDSSCSSLTRCFTYLFVGCLSW